MKSKKTEHSFRETLAPAMVLPHSSARERASNNELLKPLSWSIIVAVVLLLSYAFIRTAMPSPLQQGSSDLTSSTAAQSDSQARLIVQSPNQDQYLQNAQSPADLQPTGGQNLQQTDSYQPLQSTSSSYSLQGSAGTAAAR